MNIEKIKEHADKPALETGKRIQAVYSEHSGIQYFSVKNNLAESFELLYVTPEKLKIGDEVFFTDVNDNEYESIRMIKFTVIEIKENGEVVRLKNGNDYDFCAYRN